MIVCAVKINILPKFQSIPATQNRKMAKLDDLSNSFQSFMKAKTRKKYFQKIVCHTQACPNTHTHTQLHIRICISRILFIYDSTSAAETTFTRLRAHKSPHLSSLPPLPRMLSDSNLASVFRTQFSPLFIHYRRCQAIRSQDAKMKVVKTTGFMALHSEISLVLLGIFATTKFLISCFIARYKHANQVNEPKVPDTILETILLLAQTVPCAICFSHYAKTYLI